METQVLHWKHTKTFTFLIFYAYKSGMHGPPRLTPQKGGFAPPRENYQNLWGAAGQSWFQSIVIRKVITRKDPILSDKYFPHSQISLFTRFFAPAGGE